MTDSGKFIIFDFDGTIADTLGDIVSCINMMLENLGQQAMSIGRIRSFVGRGLPNLIACTLKTSEDDPRVMESLRLFQRLYKEHCTDTTACYPGAAEFLRARHETARPALLTNKGQPYTNIIIERLGLEGLFSRVVSGDDVRERKPDPEGILAIMTERNLKPADTVIIGDSSYDIEAGKRAGITTVAATYGFQPEETLRALKPDYMVHSFAEISRLSFI